MTTSTETCARQPRVVVLVSTYDKAPSRCLSLRVAFQAEVVITLQQHLGIDRTVNGVAGGATFAQRRVLEHVRPCLLPVALRAVLVDAADMHALGQLGVMAVGVMAVDATHPAFLHRMVILQAELGLFVQVALETRLGVLARIDNELAALAASFDVEAAGTVAALASLSFALAVLAVGNGHARMGRELEVLDLFLMARLARLHANIFRTGDHRRSDHHPVYRRA